MFVFSLFLCKKGGNIVAKRYLWEEIEKNKENLSLSYGLLEINLTEKIMDQSIIDSYIKEADRLMYEHKAKVKSYD